MHQIAVLVRGYVEPPRAGRQRAGGTVTLIKGAPNVLVDTGAPEQREELLEALANHRVTPGDVTYVVLTHGHLDHIGNNSLFPAATFVLDEDVARTGEYWQHRFRDGPLHIDCEDGGPRITVLATPGHTDHDLSVVVEASIGAVAVVGDLFEYADDQRDGAWMCWSKHPDDQRRSRDLVLSLADYIVPGHGDMFKVERK